MDSRLNKTLSEDNTTKVFELIITNPCSEPNKPVEISCVVKDLTAKTNVLDTVAVKDGFTEPILIDDLDNEEVTTNDENVSKLDAQKNIEAETSKNDKKSVVNIAFDCNDNQKESTKNVINVEETNTGDSNQTKLTSGQLVSKNMVKNDNQTVTAADSYIDLCENELQAPLDANKTDSGTVVLDIPPQNAVEIGAGKYIQSKKAVCSDAQNISTNDNPTTDSDIGIYETELQNIVTINGNREDSAVIVLDSKSSSENTITKDDNEIKILAKEHPPIDLVAEEDSVSENYPDEFKENSILSELVQKCLSMAKNGGMIRVINRTLLNIYRDVDEEYKKSDGLRKVITRTLMKLHMEPDLKFSHIKCFCDHLKLHTAKKRVPFVTLAKRTGARSTSSIPSKKSRVETIDLDNYAVEKPTTAPIKPKEYPPIEIDDSSSSIEEVTDVIIVDKKKAKKKKIKRKSKKKRKGELARAFIPTLVKNPFCTIPDPRLKQIPTQNESQRFPVKPKRPKYLMPKHISSLQTTSSSRRIDSIEEPQLNSQSMFTLGQQINSQPLLPLGQPKINFQPTLPLGEHQINSQPLFPLIEHQINSQPLLTPVLMKPVPLNSSNTDLEVDAWHKREIERLEENILFLKKRIRDLEVMEVQVDDDTSPYIIMEHCQSNLVKQYKRLCELTGTQEKKQHKVRLQVIPGHPEAPVRYLQEFLNDNIDEEGNPPFPDLYDVIQCVSKANVECNMNWGQAQIMKEARSLFIQLGQTMQKRRQKREWKDLMSRVTEEVNDPAEQDPELMMKLNRNSWIAQQKQNALLERYASLEETGLSARIASELSASIDNGGPDPETESSDDENANPGVPYTAFERQDSVTSSVSITNGNIIIQQPYSTNNQQVVGSAITLSNGLIEIAPTYDMQNSSILLPNGTPLLNSNDAFGVASIQNTNDTFVVNANQNVTSPENRVSQCNNNFSTYSLAFQKFTSQTPFNSGKCISCTFTGSNFCFHNTNVSTVNNSNVGTNSNVSTVDNRNVGTVNSYVSANNNVTAVNDSILSALNNNVPRINNSNVTTINNRNAATVNSNVSAANNNVSLINNSNATTVINSVVGTDDIDKAQSNVDLQTATNLAKSIIELVQGDALSAYNVNKNTEVLTKSHDLRKSTEVKVKEEADDKINESVCDIFTHKTKPANKNMEVKDTPQVIEKTPNDINVTKAKENAKETLSELETKYVPIDETVKREPLDISKILAELGEDFTTEIYDIEDPFLVIEISDSSESEDEVT